MAAPVPLRSDYDAEALRGLAKGSRDPAQTRRQLALSVIAAGGLRSEAAEIGGVGLQTVRDWIVAFDTDGPDGLIDGNAPGARPRLNANERDVLKTLVEQGPTPAAHGVVRWRLAETFAAPYSVQRIRDIIMRGAEMPFTDAALKSLIMGTAASAGR